MKAFSQTKKAQKVKEKPGHSNAELSRSNTAADDWNTNNSKSNEEEEKAIKDGREALKTRFGRSQTVKTPTKPEGATIANMGGSTPGNDQHKRNWMGISTKISAKDMEKID